MPWNYGDLLDAVADAVRPDAPAFIHGRRRITWEAASRRMNNLARGLIERSALFDNVIAPRLAVYTAMLAAVIVSLWAASSRAWASGGAAGP